MGVIEDLAQAREAFERREWAASYEVLSRREPETLAADDFARLATAALLLGRRNDCVQALQRAYAINVSAERPLSAVRCAFWLAMVLLELGEDAISSGWAARAERLVAEIPGEVVESGYLTFHRLYRAVFAGRFDEVARLAVKVLDYGERFDEPDLVVLGLSAQGRMLIMGGQVREGSARLDEAMAGLADGRVGTVIAGETYCLMIETCQEILDFGRVVQWTRALGRWCAEQPDLVMFTGQCAVHRGQIMRLHGAYAEALEEFDRAAERYVSIKTPAPAGFAYAERGDVLRICGDLADADAAYAAAARHGHDPQPGPALLWLAQGRTAAAVAAAQRLAAEPRPDVLRAGLLAAAVEILLAAGLVERAAPLVVDLDRCAALLDTPLVRGLAGHAAAGVELAAGHPDRALARLRPAIEDFTAVTAPYEAARSRMLLGQAYTALGDDTSGMLELTAAATAFARLGTRPAAQQVARLLRHDRPGGLTARELEVLRLVAAGTSNAGIATALVLSEKTVARHLSNIFGKLGVSSRTAAAAFAYAHDLV